MFAEDSADSQLFSSFSETPSSLYLSKNKCNTCGKSFFNSSSYKRHSGNQCSQVRKRRRKLWLPDQVPSDVDDDIAVTVLLDYSPGSKAEGNMFTSLCVSYYP